MMNKMIDGMFGEVPRTISIVKELSQGKRLTLPIGTVAMAEDMSIGFVFTDSEGNETVSGLSTMDLKELNSLLTKYQIGFVIK